MYMFSLDHEKGQVRRGFQGQMNTFDTKRLDVIVEVEILVTSLSQMKFGLVYFQFFFSFKENQG